MNTDKLHPVLLTPFYVAFPFFLFSSSVWIKSAYTEEMTFIWNEKAYLQDTLRESKSGSLTSVQWC